MIIKTANGYRDVTDLHVEEHHELNDFFRCGYSQEYITYRVIADDICIKEFDTKEKAKNFMNSIICIIK